MEASGPGGTDTVAPAADQWIGESAMYLVQLFVLGCGCLLSGGMIVAHRRQQ